MDRTLDLRLPAPQRLDVGVQQERHLRVLRHPAELPHQLLAGPRHLARLATYGAGHVIRAAQLIQDRAADPRHREGAEGEPPPCVEALHRAHEPDRAGAHQLVEVRLHGQALGELPGDVVDQIEVLEEESVTGRIVPNCSDG